MTRDRSSTYSSVIEKVIPGAKQIADRFHLSQNVLDAVKETVKVLLPERVGIKLLRSNNGDDCKSTTIDEESDIVVLKANVVDEELHISPLLPIFEEDSESITHETQQPAQRESLYKAVFNSLLAW